MALLSSTRVDNDNPGSVTVIVRETTQAGANDAVVTIRMEINQDEAEFGTDHSPGFTPAVPVDTISWNNVVVLGGTTQSRKAFINKLPDSDAVSTTVHCTINGSYQGLPYAKDLDAVIVWP